MNSQNPKPIDITQAKDPDIRASLGALKRAALQARQTAIQTNTNLIIVKDGRLLRIPPDELRRQMAASKQDTP